MTTDRQKSKDTSAKCALFSGDHTANYKGCTVYRDLINARHTHTQTVRHPGRQNFTQHAPHTPNPQPAAQTTITYSQTLEGPNATNQRNNAELQLHNFLNEFKAMFTQLINQNSTILTMLSTIISTKLNNGR
jgi:hypothetical protein